MIYAARRLAIQPGTWWLVGLAIISSAMVSASPIALLLLCATALVVSACFTDWSTWQSSMRLYLLLAVGVFLTRLAFRIIFSYSSSADDYLIQLPRIEIDLGLGQVVSLLGSVSKASMLAATVDGLRLSAIVLGVALANTLATPRKLLKATPGSLYEIATAVSIAVNLAPQLVQSIGRVRQASALRGRSKKLNTINSLIIPVLEDTIESSLHLSSSMDARGFGRRGELSKLEQAVSRTSALVSVSLIAIGTFLSVTAGFQIAIGVFLFGMALAMVSIRIASRKSVRTSINPQRLARTDLLVIALAILLFICFAGGWWFS